MNSMNRLLLATLALLSVCAVRAQTLDLLLNPIQSPKAVIKAFQPLVDYLDKSAGVTLKPICEDNFVADWQRLLRDPAPAVVIQAPHITAYLKDRKGYTPIAVVDGALSFSIVTGADDLVLETRELIGKPLAALVSPYFGAIVTNRMFADPIRRPVPVEAKTVSDAVKLVQQGKAFAAAIPTPLVGQFQDLNVVSTTEQFPLIAVSVSPDVPAELRDRLRDALLKPKDAGALANALEKANLSAGFIAPPKGAFDGLADLLKGTYGY